MAYRVELKNQSDSQWTIKVESNGDTDEVDVPPRGSLRMSWCFPVTLSIVGADARERIQKTSKLVIEPGADGPTLREETEKTSLSTTQSSDEESGQD